MSDSYQRFCGTCGLELFVGSWPFCPHDPVRPRAASVHASERAQILVNPQTGETRIEGRTDRPIHPKYRAAGFTERRDLSSLADVRAFEKKTGYIHEQTNYDNSGRQERDTGSV